MQLNHYNRYMVHFVENYFVRFQKFIMILNLGQTKLIF